MYNFTDKKILQLAEYDLYAMIGAAPFDTADQITAAYRKTVKETHPDAHPGDKMAEELFKAAANAYEILGNAENRERYDRARQEILMSVGLDKNIEPRPIRKDFWDFFEDAKAKFGVDFDNMSLAGQQAAQAEMIKQAKTAQEDSRLKYTKDMAEERRKILESIAAKKAANAKLHEEMAARRAAARESLLRDLKNKKDQNVP